MLTSRTSYLRERQQLSVLCMNVKLRFFKLVQDNTSAVHWRMCSGYRPQSRFQRLAAWSNWRYGHRGNSQPELKLDGYAFNPCNLCRTGVPALCITRTFHGRRLISACSQHGVSHAPIVASAMRSWTCTTMAVTGTRGIHACWSMTKT